MADPKDLIEQARVEVSTARGRLTAALDDLATADGLLGQAEDALPPPAPTTATIGRLWVGINGSDAFDYSKSKQYKAFIGHWYDSWARNQRYKQENPDGTLLVYTNIGVAGGSSALDTATARSRGYLAKHNGAEIPNPWNGDANRPVLNVGIPEAVADSAQSIASKWGTQGWDGLMLDDANCWDNLWRKGTTIDGYASPSDYWNRALLPLLKYLAQTFGDKLTIPNLGSWSGNELETSGALACSGGLEEHFLTWDNGQAAGNAEACYRNLRATVEAGRRWWGITHKPGGFGWAAAAIMAGDQADLCCVSDQTAYGSSPPVFTPQFDIPLVLPAEPLQHLPGSPIWERRFADGTLIGINSGALTYTVTKT